MEKLFDGKVFLEVSSSAQRLADDERMLRSWVTNDRCEPAKNPGRTAFVLHSHPFRETKPDP